MDSLTKSQIKNYLRIIQDLLLELIESPEINEIPDMAPHITQLILKTVPNKEVLHGLATTIGYLHLVKNPTDEGLRETYILGWCLQMHATCYLITDDLFDQSKTRHYKPCWYLQNNRKNSAMTDALLLESCVFRLLQQYFGEKAYYPKLINIFQKSQMKIAYATHFEHSLSNTKESTLFETFSVDNYTKCVNYKMSYYPTYVHVLMAMLLAGIPDPEKDQVAKTIFSKIDFHFQVRDDYLDVFGDNVDNEAETGNDIEQGRCTWNICTAFKLANPEEQKELIKNYGERKTSEKVAKVVYIYKRLDLPHIFKDYENKEFHEIMDLITSLNISISSKTCVPKSLFIDMMWASFPKSRFLKANEQQDENNFSEVKRNAEIYFDFLSTLPDMTNKGLQELYSKEDEISNLVHWFVDLIHYNMITGKKSRGLMVAKAFRMLAKFPTQIEIWKANILSWCVEMLQAAAIIADDVMDCGQFRRGRQCWYKRNNIRNAALNDGLFLETLIYQILESCIGSERYYAKIIILFQDMIYKTAYGQQLDVLTAREMNLDKYTRKLYEELVKYKTSLYTFVLPMLLALTMAELDDENILQEVQEVCLKIGFYFQAHDDFQDVFGNMSQTGKIGTDIAEGKCTWLIVITLEESSEETKTAIYKNYGSKDTFSKIVDIYKSIGIPEKFSDFKTISFCTIQRMVNESKTFSKEVKDFFHQILDSVFCKNE